MSRERQDKEEIIENLNAGIKRLWAIDSHITDDGGSPEYGVRRDKDGFYELERMPERQKA